MSKSALKKNINDDMKEMSEAQLQKLKELSSEYLEEAEEEVEEEASSNLIQIVSAIAMFLGVALGVIYVIYIK